METLAMEVIRFLQKWGLWEGTSIFTNGDRFEYTGDPQKDYKGICNVDYSKEWYFGHFHDDVDLEEFHCLMDRVIILE